MPNFLEGLAETVNRGFCVILSNTVTQAEMLQYVLTPGFGGQYNPFPLLYAQNCPTTPPITPPDQFSGGQCEGVNYIVNVSYTDVYDGSQGGAPYSRPRTTAGIVKGAVRGAAGEYDGNSIAIVIRGSTIARVDSATAGSPEAIRAFRYDNVVITGVTRQDGAPDTCGDPPNGGNNYQPGDNIYNNNVTYNNTNNVSVSIPVAITFGYATVNIDGTINIPINANFSANPEFNANLNFNINTGALVPDFSNPSAPVPSPCTDPGGYTPDPDIPDPPDSIPDADPLPNPTDDATERRRLLKGAIVTTDTLDGNESIIFQENNPDIYVPSLGYVQFLIRVGSSSAWTNDIPVKCLRTFIPCPWDGGAIDVKGTPRYGNKFTVSPVYVTRTFNPTYPPDS